MRKLLIHLFIIISFLSISNGFARTITSFHLNFADTVKPPNSLLSYRKLARPKIGLALSGGGVRGITQIGVLDALEDHDIPVDLIAGSSIGAAVGALYAAGYSPEEMMQIVRTVDWNTLLRDEPERSSLFLGEKQERGRALFQVRLDDLKPVMPEAYTAGQKLTQLFTDLTLNALYHASDFDDLKIPLVIIASDLLTGQKVILDHGDLAMAIRSSIAIPLLFSPVESDSAMLLDGGICRNIPVTEAQQAGADVVLAVNSTSPLRQRKNIQAPWEVADQVTTIMQQDNNAGQLKAADVVIDFSDLKIISTDYAAIDSLYHEGRRRALNRINKIKSLLAQSPHYKDYRSFSVRQVVVNGFDDSLFAKIKQPGQYSTRDIYDMMTDLYKTGLFRDIHCTLQATKSDTVLVYHVAPFPRLRDVQFTGNTHIPDEQLRQPFLPLIDGPLNVKKSTKALENMLRIYRQRGYSLAEIQDIHFSEKTGCAEIIIAEGKLNNITFQGNENTKRFIISREFTLKPGDIFQREKAKEGIENIYATGLFNVVTMGWRKQQDSYKLSINLIETPPQVIRFGLRHDNERLTRAFLEFSDENFYGMGNDLTAHIQYGMRDFKSFLNFRADRIFRTYLTSHLNVHHNITDHYAYENLEKVGEYKRISTGMRLQLGQQIARFGTLFGHLRFEEIDIDSLSGTGYDRGSLSINTIGLRTVIDTRDRRPFPRSGKYHVFFYEVSSGLVLGADKSFFKVMNRLSTFTTLGKRHTFCPKLVWGASDMTTPYSEQFRLGGFDSFFGLREGQLWGRNMLLLSLSYRLWLPDLWILDTYLSLRYDLGATWMKVEHITTDDFLSGYGGALSIKTPFGPFAIGYGFTDRGQQAFYLSMGYEF